MKQIFDWLREQMQEEPKRLRKMKNQCISLTDSEVCAIEEKAYGFYRQRVDEAEAKWESECCEWKGFDNSLIEGKVMWTYETACKKYIPEKRTSNQFKFCPYCGKKIKVVD